METFDTRELVEQFEDVINENDLLLIDEDRFEYSNEDSDEHNDETDENIARRLGFLPLNPETINLIVV